MLKLDTSKQSAHLQLGIIYHHIASPGGSCHLSIALGDRVRVMMMMLQAGRGCVRGERQRDAQVGDSKIPCRHGMTGVMTVLVTFIYKSVHLPIECSTSFPFCMAGGCACRQGDHMHELTT